MNRTHDPQTYATANVIELEYFRSMDDVLEPDHSDWHDLIIQSEKAAWSGLRRKRDIQVIIFLRVPARKLIFCLTSILVLALLQQTAHASAGYYPVSKGEILPVEVCLPASVHSPIYLEAYGASRKWVIVAKISFKNLKKDSYCADSHMQYDGPFHLKYNWKVNGFGGLKFVDPKTKKAYFGWPDGVEQSN